MHGYDYQAVSFSMAATIGLVPCRSNNLRSHPKSWEKTGISSRHYVSPSVTHDFCSMTSLRGPMHRMGLAIIRSMWMWIGNGRSSSFFLWMFLIRPSARRSYGWSSVGMADSGNDGQVHCTLKLLLMPCMYDRLSRPSCERIISAGWNYIKRSRRQLQWLFTKFYLCVQQQQHLCTVTIDESVFLTPRYLNYSVDSPSGGYKTCLITAEILVLKFGA